MNNERYLVEVSILDMQNLQPLGGLFEAKEVKKLRLNSDSLVRSELITAIRNEILASGLAHEPIDQGESADAEAR